MPPTSFISMLAGAAQACQRKTGIPASITLAQAALESSWGARALGNNLFGIKADPNWTGPTVSFRTTEHLGGKDVSLTDKFRAYTSYAESMIDHGQFLLKNPRYAPCFKETTGYGWACALQAAGYATDPEYAAKLQSIIRTRNLAFYDQLPAVTK
jgi:flagellar protein FlgJ